MLSRCPIGQIGSFRYAQLLTLIGKRGDGLRGPLSRLLVDNATASLHVEEHREFARVEFAHERCEFPTAPMVTANRWLLSILSAK